MEGLVKVLEISPFEGEFRDVAELARAAKLIVVYFSAEAEIIGDCVSSNNDTDRGIIKIDENDLIVSVLVLDILRLEELLAHFTSSGRSKLKAKREREVKFQSYEFSF